MRSTLALAAVLLALAPGCRVSTSPASGADAVTADDTSWAFERPLLAVTPAPTLPRSVPGDTMARGPWGLAISADSFRALAASVDTSVSGTAELLGRAGVFHDGEVEARSGERWQGLYPSAGGVELRSVRLAVDTARDPLMDEDDGPFTGQRVTTPFSTIDDDGYADDPVRLLVRRPGRAFPASLGTVLSGAWPITSGWLSLSLGGRSYTLEVIEGPETVWVESGERARYDRVLVLTDGEVRQPVSALIGGDAGVPAVLWAGDLDGDGWLDLAVDESTHYNLSAPALFLSSEARPGALVRRVGRHETVGC